MVLTYVWRELRRRRRQALLTAMGLAVGVALVVALSAFAGGVRDAQTQVLHSLYGVGTDITVTQSRRLEEAGPQRFGMQPPDASRQGERFSRSALTMRPGQQALAATRVDAIAGLDGVAAASGSLSLSSMNVSGRFAEVQTSPQPAGGGATPQAMPSMAPIEVSSFTVSGVETDDLSLGPLSSAELAHGRLLEAGDAKAKVALVTGTYAKQKGLAVGDTIKVGGARFEVVGLVTLPAGSSSSDVYIPLRWAQRLSDNEGKVNEIYVKASSADRIAEVAAAIGELLPKATVTTSEDLAGRVSGSLSSAASLADRLGRWLAVGGMVAAVAVASLLTVANVSRRVRELGTLRALGWTRRRVVTQVVAEAAVQGAAGAAVGVVLGVAAASVMTVLSPTLTAYTGPGGGSLGDMPRGLAAADGVASAATRAAQTVSVHLSAPVSVRLVLTAAALAVLGGLLAGAAGGWRAARLRPADALRRVE